MLTRGEIDSQARTGDRRETVFRSLDRNNDGVITRAEWPRSDAEFDRADINRDGFITRDEILARR